MADRFKRICAFILDWNITLIPVIVFFELFIGISKQEREVSPIIGIMAFLIFFLAVVAMVFRDVIFKGRSLGKRIFGLYILDKNTLTQVSATYRFLRNLFLLLYPIDAILLLATGETIGDRVANTTVISKKSIEKIDVQERTVTQNEKNISGEFYVN